MTQEIKVQARFRVASHTRYPGWRSPSDMMDKFTLQGVQGEPFGPATPSASQEIVIANPAAAALFIQALETRTEIDVFYSLVQPVPEPAPEPAPMPVVDPAPTPVETPVPASEQASEPAAGEA